MLVFNEKRNEPARTKVGFSALSNRCCPLRSHVRTATVDRSELGFQFRHRLEQVRNQAIIRYLEKLVLNEKRNEPARTKVGFSALSDRCRPLRSHVRTATVGRSELGFQFRHRLEQVHNQAIIRYLEKLVLNTKRGATMRERR